jgi:hypothetical protein
MWPATRSAFTRAVDNDPLAVDNLPLSAFSESSSQPPHVSLLRCREQRANEQTPTAELRACFVELSVAGFVWNYLGLVEG